MAEDLLRDPLSSVHQHPRDFELPVGILTRPLAFEDNLPQPWLLVHREKINVAFQQHVDSNRVCVGR